MNIWGSSKTWNCSLKCLSRVWSCHYLGFRGSHINVDVDFRRQMRACTHTHTSFRRGPAHSQVHAPAFQCRMVCFLCVCVLPLGCVRTYACVSLGLRGWMIVTEADSVGALTQPCARERRMQENEACPQSGSQKRARQAAACFMQS